MTSSCCSTAMQSPTSRSVRDKPWGTPVHVVGQPADARRTSANAASTIGRGHDLGMPPLRSPPLETLSAIFHRNRFETTKHTVAIQSPLTPLSRVESITLTCVCDGRKVEEGSARDWAYRRERHHVSPGDEELQPADWPAGPRNRAPGQPMVFRRPCANQTPASGRQFHHRNGRAPPSSLLSSTTTTRRPSPSREPHHPYDDDEPHLETAAAAMIAQRVGVAALRRGACRAVAPGTAPEKHMPRRRERMGSFVVANGLAD